jgi:hypothetical protein
VATTGILGWIARIAAVVSGVAVLLLTCVLSIPALLLAYPVHVIRRRAGKPLGWMGSWLTTVIAASVLMGVVLVVIMLQHTKSGTTEWHEMMALQNRPDPGPPPPPPSWLRYVPGAAAGYHTPTKGATQAGMILGFVMLVEIIGGILGSLTWGATWLLVSGWTGRFAFVPE